MNNNSTDDTVIKLEKLPVLIVEEKRQGTTWARRAGVACAETQWVAVIDDDIVLETGWLKSMRDFIENVAPTAVAVTGHVYTPLPPHLLWARSVLACNCSIDTQEYYRHSQPLGSATFVRRDIFLRHTQNPVLVGRDDINGTLIGCGEDIEVFTKIMRAGGRMFHNAEAKALHEIEEWRKDYNYLMRLKTAYSNRKYLDTYWT